MAWIVSELQLFRVVCVPPAGPEQVRAQARPPRREVHRLQVAQAAQWPGPLLHQLLRRALGGVGQGPTMRGHTSRHPTPGTESGTRRRRARARAHRLRAARADGTSAVRRVHGARAEPSGPSRHSAAPAQRGAVGAATHHRAASARGARRGRAARAARAPAAHDGGPRARAGARRRAGVSVVVGRRLVCIPPLPWATN